MISWSLRLRVLDLFPYTRLWRIWTRAKLGCASPISALVTNLHAERLTSRSPQPSATRVHSDTPCVAGSHRGCGCGCCCCWQASHSAAAPPLAHSQRQQRQTARIGLRQLARPTSWPPRSPMHWTTCWSRPARTSPRRTCWHSWRTCRTARPTRPRWVCTGSRSLPLPLPLRFRRCTPLRSLVTPLDSCPTIGTRTTARRACAPCTAPAGAIRPSASSTAPTTCPPSWSEPGHTGHTHSTSTVQLSAQTHSRMFVCRCVCCVH